MSDNDNLDSLVSGLRGRVGKTGRSAPSRANTSQPTESKGLNPLDVLSLPPFQRELVNWLARRKQARFSEIEQALAKDKEHVEKTLEVLKASGYVQLLLQDGEIYYSVVFSGTVSRSGRGLSSEIWGVFDQDNLTFLAQTDLLRGVPHLELEKLVTQIDELHYTRNQVILWQGDCSDCLYLVKHGLVEITRLCPNGRVEKLDYLKPGDVLGEVSLITHLSCTATATALSQVDLLRIQRPAIDDLLARYSNVAVELARILGQRLSNITAHLARLTAETSLCVLIGVHKGIGCTTVGAAIALALAQLSGERTVYTEYPTPAELPTLLSMAKEDGIYQHPGGYDVLINRDDQGWPPHVRATLVLDQIREKYTKIVACLPEGVGDKTAYWLEQADQVIVVTPPDQTSVNFADALRARLRTPARTDGASWFTVVNHTTELDGATAATDEVEYSIPYLSNMPSMAEAKLDDLPVPLAVTAQALANRLGRTYWIGIYVPSTIGVNVHADTRDYLDRTLAYMSKLFGGATSHQAQGAWSSKSADVISESISIVRSYTTQRDLDQHLPAVVEYVESLKQELKQEAMAIEINRRLMLI